MPEAEATIQASTENLRSALVSLLAEGALTYIEVQFALQKQTLIQYEATLSTALELVREGNSRRLMAGVRTVRI